MDGERKSHILAQVSEALDCDDVTVDLHVPTVTVPSVDAVERRYAGVKVMVIIWPDSRAKP